MRTIDVHKVPGASSELSVATLDEPGNGGAHHRYEIADGPVVMARIFFQDGPIGEAGVNGITHEALLAIIIDRLECFESGPYASAQNAEALSGLRYALDQLQHRTRMRIARGVEGTHQL